MSTYRYDGSGLVILAQNGTKIEVNCGDTVELHGADEDQVSTHPRFVRLDVAEQPTTDKKRKKQNSDE